MPTSKSNFRIAITPGEPAGIGPDIVIQLAQDSPTQDWVLIADADLMVSRAKQLGLDLDLVHWKPGDPDPKQGIKVLHTPCAAKPTAGHLDTNNARYVLNTLDSAITGCLNTTFDAMVTGPVQKSVINDAGISFSGHTEYLQQRCKVDQVVMMLAIPDLRVALATTHVPLRQVADLITAHRLKQIIGITYNSLRIQFNIEQPRILICGLNPHAGEDGHLGREEIDIIIPVLDEFRRQGFDLVGPLPADTLFTPKYLETADAVVAMYHDQGLPVLKSKGFGQATNVTLGLPIIRTSVDHGTALDLAASGKADSGSLRCAIETAQTLTRCQENYRHEQKA